MLSVYIHMSRTGGQTGYDKDTEKTTWERRVPDLDWRLHSSQIIHAAEVQRLEKTAIWHARLAQAMLQHGGYREALEQFQISLDEHRRNPILSKQALYVIHRDMALACNYDLDYKEALKYSYLAESLYDASWVSDLHGRIGKLMSTVQMEWRTKMTDKTVATANEAWELFKAQERPSRDRDMLNLFFSIFLGMHQTDRVRSVLDYSLDRFEEMRRVENESDDFVGFLAEFAMWRPRVMYRAFHYALMQDDGKYIDHVASILGRLEDSSVKSPSLSEAKYLLASLLFENGRVSAGIQSWYKVASNPNYVREQVRMQSLSRLAAVCLYHPEIPFCEGAPLVLDERNKYGDICLVISGWLRGHGDMVNARKALCGRVQLFTKALSDDNITYDSDVYLMLFMTVLAATDSDEDLSEVLYWIKARNKEIYNPAAAAPGDDVSKSLDQMHLADDRVQEEADEIFDGGALYCYDSLTECSSCKRDLKSISNCYFSRSRPLTILCGWCRHIQSVSTPDGLEHDFYYTGSLLQPSECISEGRTVLTSSDGGRQTVLIKEWKDKLVEKLGTADFAFEGGLSSWCMSVLPEPERTRWATFFKV